MRIWFWSQLNIQKQVFFVSLSLLGLGKDLDLIVISAEDSQNNFLISFSLLGQGKHLGLILISTQKSLPAFTFDRWSRREKSKSSKSKIWTIQFALDFPFTNILLPCSRCEMLQNIQSSSWKMFCLNFQKNNNFVNLHEAKGWCEKFCFRFPGLVDGVLRWRGSNVRNFEGIASESEIYVMLVIRWIWLDGCI